MHTQREVQLVEGMKDHLAAFHLAASGAFDKQLEELRSLRDEVNAKASLVDTADKLAQAKADMEEELARGNTKLEEAWQAHDTAMKELKDQRAIHLQAVQALGEREKALAKREVDSAKAFALKDQDQSQREEALAKEREKISALRAETEATYSKYVSLVNEAKQKLAKMNEIVGA